MRSHCLGADALIDLAGETDQNLNKTRNGGVRLWICIGIELLCKLLCSLKGD